MIENRSSASGGGSWQRTKIIDPFGCDFPPGAKNPLKPPTRYRFCFLFWTNCWFAINRMISINFLDLFCWWFFYGYHGKSPLFTSIWENMLGHLRVLGWFFTEKHEHGKSPRCPKTSCFLEVFKWLVPTPLGNKGSQSRPGIQMSKTWLPSRLKTLFRNGWHDLIGRFMFVGWEKKHKTFIGHPQDFFHPKIWIRNVFFGRIRRFMTILVIQDGLHSCKPT